MRLQRKAHCVFSSSNLVASLLYPWNMEVKDLFQPYSEDFDILEESVANTHYEALLIRNFRKPHSLDLTCLTFVLHGWRLQLLNEHNLQLNNGCICCKVRGDLIRILSKLLKRKQKMDAILIETTGLADPGPVIQTFFTGTMTHLQYLQTLKILNERLEKPETLVHEWLVFVTLKSIYKIVR